MCRHSKVIADMFDTPSGRDIYDRVSRTVKNLGMDVLLDKGVLLGLSGGADSIFLLCFLKEYQRRENREFPLLAVHVNHGIRGDEADRDEQFSRQFATSLNVEFCSYNIDVPKMSSESGLGLEETARNARYSIFGDLIESRNDISFIAVAHNATDNAETVIMNMLRGSGLNGMCGIKPIRDNILRPIIKISKGEITALLDEKGISYVTDSTNASVDYSRNYVRNEILPLFERLSSNPEAAITRLTENLKLDLDCLNQQADDFIQRECFDKILTEKLSALHPSLQAKVMSRLIYDNCGEYPEEKHISAILNLIKTDNFRYSLPGSKELVCQRGICAFVNKSHENSLCGQIFSLLRGENIISGTNLTVFIGSIDKSSLNVYNFSIQAHIRSDIIDNGLTLRFKSDGDAYRYRGMTHKLKKVFNDRNIPPMERDFIPVVCDQNGIVVVPGMSERDGAKSDFSDENITLTFAYREPDAGETELFSALLRK